jgi:phosphoribosylanthranilate isomerase
MSPKDPNGPNAIFVKICGITRLADARHAVDCGAAALGFMFWPGSQRYITPARAAEIIAELPAHVVTVGVFVNEPVETIRDVVSETGIRTVQLHGNESPAYAAAIPQPVWRAVGVHEADNAIATWPADTTLLLDVVDPERRGTGQTVDWQGAAFVARKRRVMLAGGLTPENVSHAIEIVRPFGVDVSSGVEDSPGIKNMDKVKRFLAGARSARDRQ